MDSARQILGLFGKEDGRSPEIARAVAYLRLRENDKGFIDIALAELDPSTARNRYERSQIHLFRGLFYLNSKMRESASQEFSKAHQSDRRNVFTLLQWSQALIEIAREARAEGEHEAAQFAAEQAKDIGSKVLEFDTDNNKALKLLEVLADEFNVM